MYWMIDVSVVNLVNMCRFSSGPTLGMFHTILTHARSMCAHLCGLCYRSVWDSEGNKPSPCQRGLLEPVTLSVEMHRNLCADWYHSMPTLSIDAKLEPLLVNTLTRVSLKNGIFCCILHMYYMSW